MGDVAERLFCELTKIGGLAAAGVVRSDGILRPFHWDKLAALGAIEDALAAARRAGAEEMRNMAEVVIEEIRSVFARDECTTGQTLPPFPEQFACTQILNAIRVLPLDK